ncbi:MAG: M56 family metallopeptidase [Planctomycetes bacterium]|nr:M56 family metallopeptidase [Planctomycetota bacterium]
MSTDSDLAPFVGWLLTFLLHSTCALGAALLLGAALRDRAIAWQERLLRFVLWAPLVSSSLQFLVLGGPWTGGFPSPAADAPLAREGAPLLAMPIAAAAPLADPTPPAAGPSWSLVVAALAAIAAIVGLGWLWLSRRRLARMLATRRPEPDARVLAAVAMVAPRVGLRRLPRVRRCDLLPTPIAFGLLRPEVCLPSRVGELGAASLAAMLAHELAHLRRRDPAVMALGALLQALFPWQLLLPVARRRWLRLVELRCDAIAAGHTSPTAVARCLLEVAEWLRPPPAAMPALGMAARASSLRDRIEAALQHRAGPPPRRVLSMAFGGVSLSALTFAGPGLQATPPEPPPVASFVVLDDLTSSATPVGRVLQERDALLAEAEQLQAELAGQDVSPELEQLLVALQRRLLVVQRLATRIDQRLASRSPEAR